MLDQAISIQPQDAATLRDLGRVLRRGHAQLVGPHGDQATLPQPLHDLLEKIIECLADGRALVLMPEEKQLTTQQASQFLEMSRPSLMKILDAGDIPYSIVGKHRRIALRDVLAYAKHWSESRTSAMDKMSRDAYHAGLYDDASIPNEGHDQ